MLQHSYLKIIHICKVNFKEGDIVQNIHTRKVGEAGEKIDAFMQEVWYEDDDEPIPTFITDLILYSSNLPMLQAPFDRLQCHLKDGNKLRGRFYSPTSPDW